MANQIVVSAGAKVRNLDGVLTGTSGVVNSLPINASNGIPQLDVNGKILVSQLPNSVMEYQGTWNANTNTPTLVNGTGNQGDVYLCNVAGTVDFGAGPIAFVVGDQVIYSGSIWQRASGATGTVTSVALTESGDSLNITGSPITTSGTINIGFNGTNLQYVNGAGNLTTFPTLITSIGLSMPSAFSVSNSPLTANGTIAVTGAGYASQYIRGDGTLADFPSSGGGGSSVSYYLNGGTSQGIIGGTTYYEMSKTADTGTGVDFTKSGDGFIVAFLTDANDPAQLNIPAGNWNYEIYASMSANGGTPQMYAELYKYDGTTFTLISTSTNEILYDGTNLNLYTFGMTVPATTLTLTDRLAIKLYATNSGGKTTTVHTQDSHLCQVITTFSTGITALNGLTAQVQYFATGTSGTDFNISSTTATHTFNIPSASATNRGLITTGSQTIAGSKTFNATLYGTDSEFSGSVLSPIFSVLNGTKVVNLQSLATLNRDIYLPDASGTIALTSDIPSLAGYVTLATTQTITGAKTFSGAVTLTSSVTTNNLTFANSGFFLTLQPPTLSVNRTVTLPDATGTLALTSDLSSYVTLATAQTISGVKTFSTYQLVDGGILIKHGANVIASGYTGIGSTTTGLIISLAGGGSGSLIFNTTSNYQYTFPNATGTIALVGGSGVGTVTSVAALTIGTTGTDLSSSVANSTTTPVITLNVPTASATNRGALSSADWTTFNNKQSALTNPVLASGTWTSGYLPKINGTYTIGNSLVYDNGTNVGIGAGTSPNSNSRLTISDGTSISAYWKATNTNTATRDWCIITNNANFGDFAIRQGNSQGADATVGTDRLLLSASGNLGLGVTPSAWATLVGLDIVEGGGAISSNLGGLYLTENAYFNAGWKYKSSSSILAALYSQVLGVHAWYNAPSGTAGNAITFTQAMTLTASGRLLLGTTTESTYKLDVNGTGRFSGKLTGANASFSANVSGDVAFDITNTNTTNGYGLRVQGGVGSTSYALNVVNAANTVDLFKIMGSGAATFSSSVQGNGGVYSGTGASAATIGGKAATASGLTDKDLTLSAWYPTSGTNEYGGDLYLAAGRPTGGGSGKYGTVYIQAGIGNGTSNVAGSVGTVIAANNTLLQFFTATTEIASPTERMRITSGGVVQVANGSGTLGTIAGSERLNVNGDVYAYGKYTGTSFFESSDSRLKTLIQDNYQTKGIASITPKLYTKNGKVELGYYAQDFVGVLDSAVSKGSDDMLSLSYREVLVAKVYALEQRIKELENK